MFEQFICEFTVQRIIIYTAQLVNKRNKSYKCDVGAVEYAQPVYCYNICDRIFGF